MIPVITVRRKNAIRPLCQTGVSFVRSAPPWYKNIERSSPLNITAPVGERSKPPVCKTGPEKVHRFESCRVLQFVRRNCI